MRINKLTIKQIFVSKSFELFQILTQNLNVFVFLTGFTICLFIQLDLSQECLKIDIHNYLVKYNQCTQPEFQKLGSQGQYNNQKLKPRWTQSSFQKHQITTVGIASILF
ncbi:hypothetical protein ABPG74_006660 [Tetrahymena malaccensis]